MLRNLATMWLLTMLLSGCSASPSKVGAKPVQAAKIKTPVQAFATRPVAVSATKLDPELERFVQAAMASGYKVNATRMRQVLRTVSKVDRALVLSGATAEASGKKPTPTPYPRYIKRFVQEPRPSNAVEFAVQNSQALRRAENRYGVPQSVILAIIGVETNYGRITGNYRVVDVLYTLGFYFPRRGAFFKKELMALFELEQYAKIDISALEGSFAGAMGYGQFMPSSYIEYAVDFNNDGRIDLLNDPVDAIGSVAAYLSRHGWKRGVAGISRRPNGGKRFAAELTQEPVDWYASSNFKVIKRYNNSDRYALAVLLLAETIAERLR